MQGNGQNKFSRILLRITKVSSFVGIPEHERLIAIKTLVFVLQ